MRFGVYFAAILSKRIVKMFIFYIKIIDIVLLRTIFRGKYWSILQNVCLLCNLMRLGVYFPRTFSLETIYDYLSNKNMDAKIEGRVGRCPPLEKINVFFFSSCGDLFANFLLPVLHVHARPFWACPPPPYENFYGRPCSGVVGNFLLWNTILALWSHILSL